MTQIGADCIDSLRLQGEIDELALISESPPPVVTRVLFSDADLKAREYVRQLCKEAGLSWRQDSIGNEFARWQGSNPDAPVIATGSHIDAIPNAGKYDGVVGVLGAIEAVRVLRAAGFQPRRSIEIIIFTAEEPTRFGLGCLGSRVLAGALPPLRLAALRDCDGHELDFWRDRAGLLDNPISPPNYSSFIELHIEQGPVLEQRNVPIGIVEKIAAPAALRVTLEGVGGHAGAVLMPERRDALLAAAEIVLEVEKAALSTGSSDTVATTGLLRIEPGAINSIPCRAVMEIDVRDTELQSRDRAVRAILDAAGQIASRRQIECQTETINADPPAQCDPRLIELVGSVCRDLNFGSMKMISRAYHDSLFMALLCPVTMVFIPCRGGVSHRPDEYSSPAQIAAGTAVLAETLRRLAE